MSKSKISRVLISAVALFMFFVVLFTSVNIVALSDHRCHASLETVESVMPEARTSYALMSESLRDSALLKLLERSGELATGVHCHICFRISALLEVLTVFSFAAAVFYAVSASRVNTVLGESIKRQSLLTLYTPVSLKVKLSD